MQTSRQLISVSTAVSRAAQPHHNRIHVQCSKQRDWTPLVSAQTPQERHHDFLTATTDSKKKMTGCSAHSAWNSAKSQRSDDAPELHDMTTPSRQSYERLTARRATPSPEHSSFQGSFLRSLPSVPYDVVPLGLYFVSAACHITYPLLLLTLVSV